MISITNIWLKNKNKTVIVYDTYKYMNTYTNYNGNKTRILR
jgi:hypothetical protein